MFNGCKHEWVLVDKTVLPSAYEQLKSPELLERVPCDAVMFRKKVIVILQCKVCGKLNKTIEENPLVY